MIGFLILIVELVDWSTLIKRLLKIRTELWSPNPWKFLPISFLRRLMNGRSLHSRNGSFIMENAYSHSKLRDPRQLKRKSKFQSRLRLGSGSTIPGIRAIPEFHIQKDALSYFRNSCLGVSKNGGLFEDESRKCETVSKLRRVVVKRHDVIIRICLLINNKFRNCEGRAIAHLFLLKGLLMRWINHTRRRKRWRAFRIPLEKNYGNRRCLLKTSNSLLFLTFLKKIYLPYYSEETHGAVVVQCHSLSSFWRESCQSELW